jgi:hypothetical protein
MPEFFSGLLKLLLSQIMRLPLIYLFILFDQVVPNLPRNILNVTRHKARDST